MGSRSFCCIFIFFNMKFFALFALVAVAAAFDQAWEDYKLEFDKHYTPEEEAMRYANWKKDTEEVLLHNAMYGHEFTQGVNALSDLTEEEYKQQYLSSLIVPTESNATMHVADNNMSTAPDVTATTDAEEVGTNPAGDTPRMPAVTRVR